jgi:pyrroloquinoline quinone biosynthesis protein B
MRIRVLGAAAGGGFPQWNCGCPNCRGVRAGTIRARPRSQESVALSADGEHWFLLNASPEIRAQLESFPPLHPRAPRDWPVAGIVLTNGDLDHCLGLLSLRESHPLVLYATDLVRRGFTERNVLYRTLERFEGQATWRRLEIGREIELTVDGRSSGLAIRAVAAPGKAPIHLEGLEGLSTKGDEENIGLVITEQRAAKRTTVAYFSAAGGVTSAVREAASGADCLFFDGTFWSETELVDLGLGGKRAADMAHVPIGGADGSLRALADVAARRRVFIHVNNTNPILREDSPEAAAVRAAGWEVAEDGMEIEL